MSTEKFPLEPQPTSKSGAFVSIYKRWGINGYNEHDTKERAIRSLEDLSDEGLIISVAVIEIATKKMVWYQEVVGKAECQQMVDRFINRYGL